MVRYISIVSSCIFVVVEETVGTGYMISFRAIAGNKVSLELRTYMQTQPGKRTGTRRRNVVIILSAIALSCS